MDSILKLFNFTWPVLYFAPYIVARFITNGNGANLKKVFWINLLGGWTVVMWFVAMRIAVTGQNADPQVPRAGTTAAVGTTAGSGGPDPPTSRLPNLRGLGGDGLPGLRGTSGPLGAAHHGARGGAVSVLLSVHRQRPGAVHELRGQRPRALDVLFTRRRRCRTQRTSQGYSVLLSSESPSRSG